MGETMEQRIELAFTLKDLAVDCVPVNILNPRPGTPLMDVKPLPPVEILVSIAIFRFILPDKDIKLCGGKRGKPETASSIRDYCRVQLSLYDRGLSDNTRKKPRT